MLSIGVSFCSYRRQCEICRLCFITNLIIDLFEGAFSIGLRQLRNLRSWHIITLVNDVYYHQDIIRLINGSTSR